MEYVIRAGRTIVDRGQIDQSNDLTRQIDQLKASYNHLGAKVKKDNARAESSSRKLSSRFPQRKLNSIVLNDIYADFERIILIFMNGLSRLIMKYEKLKINQFRRILVKKWTGFV